MYVTWVGCHLQHEILCLILLGNSPNKTDPPKSKQFIFRWHDMTPIHEIYLFILGSRSSLICLLRVKCIDRESINELRYFPIGFSASSTSGIFTCFHIPLSFKNFSLWPVVKLWGIFIRLSKNKFLMSQTLWCNIAHWNEKEEKPVGTGFRRVVVPIPYLFFARLISSVRPFLPYLLKLLTCPYMAIHRLRQL